MRVAERAAEPTAPPRLSPAKQAGFAVVAVVLMLVVLEVSVRIYHYIRNVGTGEEPRGYVIDDAETGYSLKPGYIGSGIRINNLGFRGPEIPATKAPGVQRIVALGDSATFGPHEEECAYPYLLPDLVAPRQVESINAAVEGYRTDRALVHVRRDVLPLQPDVITIFLGWNDLYQTDPNDELEKLSLRGGPLSQIFALSDAAQTFRRVYFLGVQGKRAQTQGGSSVPTDYQPVGYAERLGEIIRTARAGGASVWVLTWPTILSDNMSPEAVAKVHYPPYTNRLVDLKVLYADYQQTLRQVAADEHAPLIDIAAVFDALPDKAVLFKDTAHFSCDGQAIVARTVTQALARDTGR
jgi:lysophospholipase L1-like esterase